MRRARKIVGVVAGVVGLRLARRVLDRSDDGRNVRALAAHLACSVDDARRAYRLARIHGFGAAYEEVFGKPVTTGRISDADAHLYGAHRRGAEVVQSGALAAAVPAPDEPAA